MDRGLIKSSLPGAPIQTVSHLIFLLFQLIDSCFGVITKGYSIKLACSTTARNYAPFQNTDPEVITGNKFPCSVNVTTTLASIGSSRVIVCFGDGSPVEIVPFTSSTNTYTFSLSHTYNLDALFTITATYHNLGNDETTSDIVSIVSVTCKINNMLNHSYNLF